jgi:uncharacterized protein (TIRG00374 family)
MKKIFLFLISLLIGIALFVWVIKFIGWQEIKIALLVLRGWEGIVILLLTIVLAFMATWKWKEILKTGGNNLPFFDLLKYHFVGFSISYLFPIFFLGREAFQSYILKERNNLPLSKGITSTIIAQILDWTTNLIVIFFGFLFFLLEIGSLPKKIGLTFGVFFFLAVIAISFFYFFVFKRESLAKFLFKISGFKKITLQSLEIEKGLFRFFRIKKPYFWKIFFLALLEEGVLLLRIWLLVNFLGREINFLFSLSILGFSYLALMVPLPAVLGIHEGLQAFAFKALGIGVSRGTAFTMIVRGADLFISLIGIFILFRLGYQLLIKTLFKNKNNFLKKD